MSLAPKDAMTGAKAAAVLGWCWGVIAQTVPTTGFGEFANIGVLGVLAYLLIVMMSRMGEWEKTRHDDSEKLAESLRMLTSQCAAVQAIRKREE